MSKHEKNESHIIVDRFGRIHGNNSGSIQILNLEGRFVKKKNIFEILPMLEKPFEKFKKYIGKNPRVAKIVSIENSKPVVKKVLFTVFKMLKGRLFTFKIWDYFEEYHNQKSHLRTLKTYKSQLKQDEPSEAIQSKNFSFRLSRNFTLQGNFLSKSQSQDFSKIAVKKVQNILVKQMVKITSKKLENKKSIKVDYSEGIRVKRLDGEMIRDIYEDENSELFSSFEKDETKKKLDRGKILQTSSTESFYTSKIEKLKSQKQLVYWIEKFGYFSTTLKAYIFVFIFCMVLSLICFAYSNILMRKNLDIASHLSIVAKYTALRSTNLQLLHATLTDISYANSGYDLSFNAKTPKLNLNELKESCLDDFKFHLSELKINSEKFHIGFMGVGKVEEYLNIRNSRNVSVKMKGNYFADMTFYDSIQQILTKGYSLLQRDINEIGFSDEDTDFITYNAFNKIHQQIRALSVFSNWLNQATILSLENFGSVFWRIYVTISFVSFVLISISIQCYQKEKEKMILMYYGFNNNEIKQKKKQLEKILNEIEQEEERINSLGVISTLIEDESNFEEDFKLELKKKEESEYFFNIKSKKKKGNLSSFLGYYQFLTFIIMTASSFITVSQVLINSGVTIKELNMINSFKISFTGMPQATAYINNLMNLIRYPNASIGRLPVFEEGIFLYSSMLAKVKKNILFYLSF